MEKSVYNYLVAYHFYDGKQEGYGHALYSTNGNLKTRSGIEAIQNEIARHYDTPASSVVILNIVELDG